MEKKVVFLKRKYQDKNLTLGYFYVQDEKGIVTFADVCLELPWRKNERNISCVPAGLYNLVYEWSPRFNMMLWELKGVPGRSECKFHAANYVRQLNGCIAPGTGIADIDGDGILDVVKSGESLNRFHAAMGTSTKAVIIITDDFPKASD